MASTQNSDKLELWQQRLADNDSAFAAEREKMDAREKLYRGDRDIKQIVPYDKVVKTPHVRNLAFELIESQVSSVIPQPKVTARYQKDTAKAKIIEDMIRNELDRLPMEMLNDMAERTVPIQGGVVWLIEWDNTIRTAYSIGEITAAVLHPKQIVPQDGIYSSIEDMDYIILKFPQTVSYIKSRYGVDLEGEVESEPDIKSIDGSSADDLVTQYVAYYRNENCGIGLYSWVNDTELEDIEDYQSRQQLICPKCGAPDVPQGDGKKCAICGAKLKLKELEYEEVYEPRRRSDGSAIGGITMQADGTLGPTKLPYYKPNIFPVILQKNVSMYGQLLGDSDIDKISSQQNTTNRLEAKIIDRLCKAGTRITLPDRADLAVDPEDNEIWRVQDITDVNLIKTLSFEGNLQYEMAYLAEVYEEARQTLGITDSFQGRNDRTATSKVAKEFAAKQSAGRLESKRAVKKAVWAQIFEAIFKFKLAYTDEPRPVISETADGRTQYDEFNRYDFLEQDSSGRWFYNDAFLFSCDTNEPLANNREALWQEARMNLERGAYGNPQDPNTLIIFWARMEQLAYPGAADVRKYIEGQIQAQQEQMQMQQMMQQEQMAQAQYAQQQAGAQMAQQKAAQTEMDNWNNIGAEADKAIAQIKKSN